MTLPGAGLRDGAPLNANFGEQPDAQIGNDGAWLFIDNIALLAKGKTSVGAVPQSQHCCIAAGRTVS